jgi:hypothetical protein
LPANKRGPNDSSRVLYELEMLSSAKKNLASRPLQALATVEQHAREFPDSQLVAQRVEIRVAALCALGRDDQARAAAASHKSTPAVAAALKTCKK